MSAKVDKVDKPCNFDIRKEIAMCRNGWGCRGRSSGKCYFTHPTEPPANSTK